MRNIKNWEKIETSLYEEINILEVKPSLDDSVKVSNRDRGSIVSNKPLKNTITQPIITTDLDFLYLPKVVKDEIIPGKRWNNSRRLAA